MRKIYFYFKDYPNWVTGGEKYHTVTYNILKSIGKNVFIFGDSIFEKRWRRIRIFQLTFALYHFITIPRKSTIILSNSLFFSYTIPLILNKIIKHHKYCIIVHHLIQRDRPTKLRKWIENFFLKNIEQLIANSYVTRTELVNLGINPDNIPVIYPGLDISVESLASSKHFMGEPKILFVGSVEKRKGVLTLIESLTYLSDEVFRLDIIGNTSSQPDYVVKCKEAAKSSPTSDCIHFHGRVSDSRLEQYYREATLFVLPSLWEGFGIVIAEAMVYKLPIICSKIPVFEELIIDKEDGILVPPNDSEQLGLTIKKMLNNKDFLKTLSENAYNKSKMFHSWKYVSQKIWEVISL